ncbi:hypothetical protein JCM8547_003233 [Rhodosporidiobolus lusitaniae]
MPLPPLSSTSPLDWRYVAEGGANLVLSFCGQPDSPYAGHALRLRKRKKRSCGRDEHDEVPAEVNVEFGRIVVEPLLGKAQVPETGQIELKKVWLEQLVGRMKQERVRPAHREEEDEVELDAKEGVVVEDLIRGEGVLAVEIKPKWGFLPSPAFLSPSTALLKTTYCRFCMHRYHKRVSSSTLCPQHRSIALAAHEQGYCPLDLYSSNSKRVERAVTCLFAEWASSNGEKNSLRVFLDGEKLSPRDPSSLARLDHALQRLRPPAPPRTADLHRSSSGDPSHETTPGTFSSLLSDVLLASPLLATLRRLQSILDALDIEGLAAFLERKVGVSITSASPALSRLGSQPSMEEWRDWMEQFRTLFPSFPSASSTADIASAQQAFLSTAPRFAVLAYLLSATFKDCSLIVRLPLSPPLLSSSSMSTGSFSSAQTLVSVKAIDLDPKPIIRLAKYWSMDQEIVKSWQEFLDGLSAEEREGIRRFEGRLVPLKDIVKLFKAILAGEHDSLPEAAFYMVGDIADVKQKAERLAAEISEGN